MKICFISLGCDKNTVDSEKMLKAITKGDKYDIVLDPEIADVVVLNTCAFIKDAKKESLNYITYLKKLKSKKKSLRVIITGCLVKEGHLTNNYNNYFGDSISTLDLDDYLETIDNMNDRMMDILSFSSFIKISDGCDKCCSYCIIPKIRGRFRSKSFDDIILETKFLAKNGVKELNIVSQDTLSYGKDLNDTRFNLSKEKPFVTLINEMSKVKGIEWFRLLYCYPEDIDDSVIRLIKENKKVIPYIDMPIQHTSDKILKLMNRRTTKDSIKSVIAKLRKEVPDICIRTTLLVGFPGETEDDFNELYEFVNETAFDKLGVFTYSREALSNSYNFENQVDEKVKKSRRKQILDLQKNIVIEKNKEKLGKVYSSLVEGKISASKNSYIVRPYFNAKGVDDKVIVKSNDELLSGTFVNVKITKVKNYDLEGVIV